MKIEMEVDDDFVSSLVVKDLRWHIDHWHEDVMDKKESKKLLKALKKVHNFYSPPSEHVE